MHKKYKNILWKMYLLKAVIACLVMVAFIS
jgi:hypothetical protein